MQYAVTELTTAGTLDDQLASRLLQQRIIVLGTEVDDQVANRLCAQLLLLSAEDPRHLGQGPALARPGPAQHLADDHPEQRLRGFGQLRAFGHASPYPCPSLPEAGFRGRRNDCDTLA
jgi:hypothetical protein